MKKIIHIIKEFFSRLLRFFNKLPKSWVIHDLGSTLPLPPAHPQDEPLFTREEHLPGLPRDRVKCYRNYSELLGFLAEHVIDNSLLVGETFYISRQMYVNHHLEQHPNANPRSYYNGPIARELKDHQFFTKRGVKFKQQLVQVINNEHGYKVGEVLFKIERAS